MEQYMVCRKTVMNTSDPSTVLDAGGVSNHYHKFDQILRPRWEYSHSQEAQKSLERIVAQIKKSSSGKDFDCLLGLSGGLDSSYMLHKMVTEYGLRPLVFHVDGGWNSEVSSHNINALVDKLGVDLFTEVIDWSEMRDFQLALFKAGVPHLDIPQDMAFISVLYKFAERYNIKHILNGGNISTECVDTPLKYLYWGTDMKHIRDILKRFGTVDMKTFPFSSIYYHKIYLPYIRRLKVIKPLNLIPYYKAEAEQVLQTIYGWKSYEQKHFESRFTKFYEGYWLPKRFDYDMRMRNLSSLILTSQLAREKAMQILKESPISESEILSEKEFVASKLGITMDELEFYEHSPKRYYWNYRNQNRIFELGEMILYRLKGTARGGAY